MTVPAQHRVAHYFPLCGRLLAAVFITLLLATATASPLSAQNGILFVRVHGPGGPVPARVDVLYEGQVVGWGEGDQDGRVRIGGIPGGTYSIQVRALGHKEFVMDSIRVEPGESRAVEVTLELAPIAMEELTVRAQRVQIQRENTEFSTEVDQVAIEMLPMSFTAADLVALTPGARPGHIWGGANFQANSYRLDGLSTNHPGMGGDLLQPSIYWIDRVEVRGLGAGAEYGGFQGGLVDVVTKSGSNQFQGNLRLNTENELFNNSNLVNTEIGTEVVHRQDVEGEVRGPLVRDRLFYFLSGKFVLEDQKALNHLPQIQGKYAPVHEEMGEEKLFGKITWEPGPTHQVEVSGAYTDTHAENFATTGFEAEGAGHKYASPTWFVNASAREILSDWAVLEGRFNHFSRDESYEPYQGRDTPGLSNFALTPPYNAFQNAPYTLRSAPTSTSATLTGTFRATTGDLEHSLKVGGEVTWGGFLDQRIRNGGVTWLPVKWSGFDPADPSTWTQPATSSRQIASHWGGEVHLDTDVMNASAFAQAALALGPRIVLSPGVRFSQWKGWLTPKGQTERFLAVQDEGLDPRVGLLVDLDDEGTLVAKAHWGRYHQNMISQMFDRVEGGNVFTNEEFWYYQGETFTDPTTTFTEAERNALAEQFQFTKQGEVFLNETGPVENYRQPYVDQWLIGLEKQVGNWMKIEALYTRRSNHDMVALVDRNRATNYTAFERVRVFDSGLSVVPFSGGSVYFPVLYVPNNLIRERLLCFARGDCDPRDVLTIPGMTPADTLGLTWNPDYVLTTAPDGKREFSQFQFNVEVAKPTFGGSISLVLTDLEGNLDNVSGYTDPAGYGAGPYVHVNQYTNSYGTLENFADMEVKISGWGNLPWNLRGGLFWTLRTGDHYSPRFRLYGIGFFRYFVGTGALQQGGIPEFHGQEVDYKLLWPTEGQYVFVGPRGNPTLERQSILDMRLEKVFTFQGQRMAVSVDVFNLLSSEAITELNTIVNNGPDYGFSQRQSMFSPGIQPNQFYQAPQERVKPRTFRLGVSWFFGGGGAARSDIPLMGVVGAG